MSEPRLLVTASPHLRGPDTTPRVMWTVALSLVPVLAVASWFWGVSALLVTAASVLGAALPEALIGRKGSLRDGSAVVTGVLLAMTLPPGLPMWSAFVGGAFGVLAGKLVFGGLGQNPFNPALLGRAFLQAAFPVALTTWPVQQMGFFELRGDNFAFPLLAGTAPDVVTAATPLGLWKFEAKGTGILDLFLGRTGGCIGETSALVILLCGGFLALKNYLNWRLPLGIFATVAVFSGVLWALNSDKYASPVFMLFSGGLVLGAVYMATDPVTTPITNRGRWIYAAGVGILVVLIRVWGGLAEGVMYAILLMNACVPFINRGTQPRVFGARRKEATT